MLFYAVGEMFQDRAVDKARSHIKSLLDVRPQTATVRRDGQWQTVAPETVGVGEEIEVKTGERVPLDGVLLEPETAFNTAALTGESVPRMIGQDEEVLAGMIPTERVVRLRTVRGYTDSALSRILDMVQHAASRKAPTEQFIRRFARVYTPAVTMLAALLVVLPWLLCLMASRFHLRFSCMALPGVGLSRHFLPLCIGGQHTVGLFRRNRAASRRGILFKGSNYLDAITHIDAVVFDKTGTLTCGVFRVQEVHPSGGLTADELLAWAAAAESGSNHPIARAVGEYAKQQAITLPAVRNTEERAGLGLRAMTDRGELLVGKAALLAQNQVAYPEDILHIPDTIVVVALDGRYAGYLLLADEPKPDASRAVAALHGLASATSAFYPETSRHWWANWPDN